MSSFPEWPDTPPKEDELMRRVESGNVQSVRDYFDDCLFRKRDTGLRWDHLRTAVLAMQQPMVQLLVTWGAKPAPEDLAELNSEKIRLLYQCGLRMGRMPPEPVAAPATAPKADTPVSLFPCDARIDRIPEEWLKVVLQLRVNGAFEAMIAGGALRDLYNGAQVKDVDIFMSSRMFSQRFILNAFSDAGIEVHNQSVAKGYGHVTRKAVRTHAEQFNKAAQSLAESWTIIAGPDRTEYNIILLRGALGKEIKAAGKRRTKVSDHIAMDKVIKQFDIGLCQIACNGEYMWKTLAYVEDSHGKKITLTRPNHASHEHLKRVVMKYPEHRLCPEADKLLNPPKKQKKVVRNGYGYISRPSRRSGYGGFSGY